jgi:hypothetical protein
MSEVAVEIEGKRLEIEAEGQAAAEKAAEQALRDEFAELEAKEREERFQHWVKRKQERKPPLPLSAIVRPKPVS